MAVERRVTLPAGVDLHARPAGVLARAAMGYAAEVTVVHGDRDADAKSVLRLMALGAEGGAVLIVRARGADAEEAAAGLTKLLETLS